MKLNVHDRIMALTLLPKEGNFFTIRLIRGLQAKLGCSDAELVEFGINQKNGVILPREDGKLWNEKGEEEREIEFGEREKDLITDALSKFDKEGKLTQDHFGIYTKFMEANKT